MQETVREYEDPSGEDLQKREKSGSGQPNRTTRDDEIVIIWGFLKQHIVRGGTVASDTVGKLFKQTMRNLTFVKYYTDFTNVSNRYL